MRSSHVNAQGKAPRIFALAAALCVFAAMPLLSSARARAASISIANNSGRSVIHVYLSHTDQDDWGPNQLGDSTIASGDSYTISNVSWDASQVKVVAEDSNGCFLYAVVSSSTDSTWAISASTPADCGGN
jgi:hypothetical protein